jgi:very-short-patch-repair endonuclease
MWIVLLIAALSGLWLLREFANHIPRENSHWPVFARSPLTMREQFLYHRLSVMYPEHIILAQVALSQIIDVSPGTSNRQAIRGKFKQRVADFVLCRCDFSIVAVIELDDPSHAQPHRQDADARKKKAVESAGLTFVRIPAGPIPSETDLRRVIQPDVTVTQAVAAAPTTTLRVAHPEKEAVRRSFVGLAVIIAIIAAGWVIYSQLRTISVPSAVAVMSLAAMPRLAGQGAPMPEFRPAATALAPAAMRPTADEQEAEKQEKARAALAAQQMVIETAKRKEKAWAAYFVTPRVMRASACVEGSSGLWKPIYSREARIRTAVAGAYCHPIGFVPGGSAAGAACQAYALDRASGG